MTKTLTDGLDGAVEELVLGLMLLNKHIDRAGVTDPAVLHLRDNLTMTIEAWKRDVLNPQPE
jgi:hypothetical protein